MKIILWILAAAFCGFMAQWLGLSALVFAAGHFWMDCLIASLLAIAASVEACFFSALLVVEWLKDR